MSTSIPTTFLPVYDERNACYRAVIEVADGTTVSQYYCKLDVEDAQSGIDIYEGLQAQALMQHQVLTSRLRKPYKLAA